MLIDNYESNSSFEDIVPITTQTNTVVSDYTFVKNFNDHELSTFFKNNESWKIKQLSVNKKFTMGVLKMERQGSLMNINQEYT
ncbi:hypothetical protein A3Q56_08603 [Intoshia linei]|uniref:Uncharacterized protein n=1 Tax=Intoshia linei TaxID=1819745 RepID=A0A177ANT4_9BILA|nr:hypothetical protein A3Q56_08603 [Intoshia linei]